jgi:hypothetical protein
LLTVDQPFLFQPSSHVRTPHISTSQSFDQSNFEGNGSSGFKCVRKKLPNMLIKAFSKLVLFIGPFVIIWYMFVYFDGEQYAEDWSEAHFSHDTPVVQSFKEPELVIQQNIPPSEPERILDGPPSSSQDGNGMADVPFGAESKEIPPPPQDLPPLTTNPNEANVDKARYRELFSVSAPDKKYFSINFAPDHPTMNPNIIPHPYKDDTWIIVAQSVMLKDGNFEEVACNAVFQLDGSLACSTPLTVLPVAPSRSENCKGEFGSFTVNSGPRDMRVFYGPDAPYVIYGSQSAHTCFSLFTQDFRSLHYEEYDLDAFNAKLFATGTELQRPPPGQPIEKNWYMFWDSKNAPYAHHDISPKRVFAQILPDGSVGPDLAPNAALNDDACMARYVPKTIPDQESIHQATNALAVTLCARSDPACVPSDENTFILTIFQHKRYRQFHATYEPYVMLTQSVPPFAIHAISTKPIWIHGRGPLTRASSARYSKESSVLPEGHTEMFYVTSINWKEKAVKWRGHVDDVVLLGFGIEDERTAGIDVKVADLLLDLGVCGEGAS